MGFFGKIGGFISKAAGFVSKAVDFVKKPFDMIQNAASGLISKLASKLPFGLGKIAGPLLQKLLPVAMNFLMPGGVGALSGLFKAANTVGKFADMAKQAGGFLQGLDGGGKGLGNLQEIATHAFAQNLLGGMKLF